MRFRFAHLFHYIMKKTLCKLCRQTQSYLSSTNINQCINFRGERSLISFYIYIYIYTRKNHYNTHVYSLFVLQLRSFSRPQHPSSWQQPARTPSTGSFNLLVCLTSLRFSSRKIKQLLFHQHQKT